MVVSIVLATALPFLFLFVIYRLNLYAAGSYKFVIACFGWGAAMVLVASFVANQLVFNLGWVDQTTLVRYVAPVTEEILKGLILIYLMRRPEFTYFVDGAIYGFAVGIGFAILENTLYLSADPDVSVAISRVVSTNLMHATATAILGMALGYARFQRFSGRFLLVAAGLVLAIAVHMGFNNLVTRNGGNIVIVYAAICGAVGLGFVVFMIKRGLSEQKGWIEEELDGARSVTRGEAAIVQNIDNVFDILTPLARQFGAAKAEKIEAFLMLQARLGILSRTLSKMQNEAMRAGVERQIASLQEEIDVARREVGPYCMIYLRNIFPEESSPLWQTLESRIKNRPRTAASGKNMWQNLRARTQPGTEE